MFKEDEYLQMSGIQHFSFCRRQWALIHVEQQWEENYLTAEGRVQHEICHDEAKTEKRGNVLIIRGYRVVSHELNLTGICDVIEFVKDEEDGIALMGYEGRWLPHPIEYKHGHSKTTDTDRLQLCAQVMALEEMLQCSIRYGYLFYKETHRREQVDITDELRQKTKNMAQEMMKLYARGHTPKVKTGSFCKSCSLKEICVPRLNKNTNVGRYIRSHLEEME